MKSSNLIAYWFNLQSWKKILFALFAGISVGLMLGDKAIYLNSIGMLFINAIKMMIVPVIFTAIVCAVLSMQDSNKIRRIGLKTLLLYVISMSIAAVIGLFVATLIAPGTGLLLPLDSSNDATMGHLPSFASAITNLIPANAFIAFSTANVLQILIFAIFMGVSINLAGEPATPVRHLFQAFSAVVFKLTAIVMSFAPYGIFALMAATAGEYGFHALVPLFKLVFAGYLSCLLLGVVFYPILLNFVVKLNPIIFYKGITSALIFAFSSSSSTATLPVSMRCAKENLGISEKMTGFLLPLGTTLNLNGLAIYLSIASVFSANIYGIHLGVMQYITLLVTIVLTSMGAGGIPGSALIVMGAVMSSIGLPLGAIPMIAGIDRIIDMGMTATNVAGDLFATAVIAHSENELDRDVFYNAIS
jgi:Na+/H+-dicarboxylate symporter